MKTPFVEHGGKLYVRVRSTGIPPLCAVASGWMSVCTWPKDKHTYIPIDQAIRWHEKELEQTHGRSGSRKALAALQKARLLFISKSRQRDEN